MKKIFFVCVMMMAVVNVCAQDVFGINKVELIRPNEGVVYAGDHNEFKLNVPAYVYRWVKDEPATWLLAVYNGEGGSEMTVVRRTNVDYGVFSIEKVEYDEANGVALVYLSNKTVYKSKNLDWLKVQPGQHFERWFIDGESKVLEHCRTVARTVKLTTAIPYKIAPRPGATRVVEKAVLDENAAIKGSGDVAQLIKVERVGASTKTQTALINK